MKKRCVIIDDDAFAINQLRDALELANAPIQVVGVAYNGREGFDIINREQPDLVFLDAEMPDMSGFEMLSKIPDIQFKTIFTTSFTHYAIRAIRFNALDYLVKPIDIDELRGALRRFNQSSFQKQNIEKTIGAINNHAEKNIENQRIILHQHDGIVQTTVKDILFVEAQSNYSRLRLMKNKNILVSKNLGYFETRLHESGFYRCHKSYLVHGRHIKLFTRSSSLIMTDDTEIPISRRKKKEMMAWFETLN